MRARTSFEEEKRNATAFVWQMGCVTHLYVLAEVAVEVKMVVRVMGRAIQEAAKVAHEVAVVDALERLRRGV